MSQPKRYTVLVCRGPECGERRGSEVLAAELVRLLRERGLTERVTLGWQSCFGRCSQACNVLVKERVAESPGTYGGLAALPGSGGVRAALYGCVKPEEVRVIVDEHLVKGRRVREMMMHPSDARRDGEPIAAALLRKTGER